MSAKKTRIVIIGGGFGGVYTARHLQRLVRRGRIEVTLINRTNYFLFTPLLHEVASGGLTPLCIAESLREVFRHENMKIMQAEVTAIDTAKKRISTNHGSLTYDYLVLSPGCETNYFNTPGTPKHVMGLKNLSDALAIRNRVVDLCEKATLVTKASDRKQLLSFVVVGGGATGVEIAAEIAEFLYDTSCKYYSPANLCKTDISVTLVSSGDDLIPQFNKSIRKTARDVLTKKGVTVKTGAMVMRVDESGVTLKTGETISASTVIWVAGVMPSRLSLGGMQTDKTSRVLVDENLRATGYDNIFVLGDTAMAMDDSPEPRPLPMLAQVAESQARHVADSIASILKKQPLTKYHYHSRGMLLSLGQWYAAGEIFGITLRGRLMWWVWRTVYLFKFLSWRKRVKIAAEWTINLFYPRDITKVN